MKPTAVCIFAHPDDEAFGPGGTIALLSQTHDVYLICATRGESKYTALDEKKLHHSIEHVPALGMQRTEELQAAAKVLGIKQVFFLDFIDGTLSNNNYHQIATKILAIVEPLKPELLLTYEPQGVSGHIDHITMSMVTSFIFQHIPTAQKVMYFCKNKQHDEPNNYFIFHPPGYKPEEIDEFVDISSVWDIKIEAMRQHKSQIKDINKILPRLEKLPKIEHFLVKTK